jgi:hypothetical protein
MADRGGRSAKGASAKAGADSSCALTPTGATPPRVTTSAKALRIALRLEKVESVTEIPLISVQQCGGMLRSGGRGSRRNDKSPAPDRK